MRHRFAPTRPLAFRALVGLCALVPASRAFAQEATYLDRPLPPPSEALELRVATGYTQGFGMLAPGRGVADVAGPGATIELDADYRTSRLWSMGLGCGFQEFVSSLNTGARGVAADAGVTLHAAPSVRGDPWLRVGAGYRLIWDVNPPATVSTARQGLEIAKATLGYDVRVARNVAFSPVVGADLNLFLWQTQNRVVSPLSSGQIATFLFLGVQGRFDLEHERPRHGLRSSPGAADLAR
jgi:hypothetical protein